MNSNARSSEDVLTFWFGETRTSPANMTTQSRLWYKSNPEWDRQISAEFGYTHQLAASKSLQWTSHPQEQLAQIILLDQFSRNMFRKTARAFAFDATALLLTQQLLDTGDYLRLSPIEQIFAFHPLEHSEDPARQRLSVEMFRQLADRVDESWRPHMENFLQHAIEHHDIVAQFGRFPHRNKVLGRDNTAAEAAYLRQGKKFGQ